ncbi:MAG: ParB N-terminal domain-containing protein [Acidiferrobacterales bacterium]
MIPPHAVKDFKNFERLTEQFLKGQDGWDPSEPALIGYPFNGRIQLLSGSHRWAAAKEAGIQIPVLVRQRSVIEEFFGNLDEWAKIMSPLPTSEVENYE